MNKKGISPLIAIVLILVFTVAVGTTVVTWMMDYTKTTTTAVTEATSGEKGVVSCSQEIIDIASVYATDGLSTTTTFSDGVSSKNIFVPGTANASATVTISKTASITGASIAVSSMYDTFDDSYNYGADNQNTHHTQNYGPTELKQLWNYSRTIKKLFST